MTYIFETKLQTWDEDLNIARTVQISSSATLADLGYLLMTVYGAQGYHFFDFTIGRSSYGCDEEAGKLACDLSVAKAFGRNKNAVFSYDYGDGWAFDVKLAEKKEEDVPQLLLSGTGRGIVEDVGGTGGLEAFVEAFKEGKGEEYEAFCDWQGIKQYDAETCKVDRINEMAGEIVKALRDAYENGDDVDARKFKAWYEDCFGVHYWVGED